MRKSLKDNIKNYVEVPILNTGIFENLPEDVNIVAYGVLRDISRGNITLSPGVYILKKNKHSNPFNFIFKPNEPHFSLTFPDSSNLLKLLKKHDSLFILRNRISGPVVSLGKYAFKRAYGINLNSLP